MPFFSVIVPVYDKAASLEAALESVYGQTCQDFELVAVDDGSQDGSMEILARHAAQGRLTLLQRNSPGPGGYAARNHGASLARAPWLTFLDADDLYRPDHLRRLHEAIVAHPGIELFVNAYQKMEDGRPLPRLERLPDGRLARREALRAFARSDFIHMNGACLRRERFLQLGGFPVDRYRRGGDVYFWLKVLCELDAIHYCNSVTSLWQLENSGVTRDKRNLVHLHPGVDLLAEYAGRLTKEEARQLHAAINRKVLSWAVEKKRLGQPVRQELAALSHLGMQGRHWLHATTLLIPQPYYDRLRRWVK
ncbi:MAG: glycosyltransferase family 2 protein [Halomonas sp.]|uniref:Glycosyltransferase family 2 protein n=1 Tax=Billgrantia antri TaxID=2846777 RepID=A0ABS6ZS32_9GAMM|nr:glycosyltransferase family A protein [Halomonas antri]MBW6392655.1 glycosyltransferase family 2 protein [Halomonas antri]MDX5376941.1 glycosyltransferase family 2 protein [Halomonas sp.]